MTTTLFYKKRPIIGLDIGKTSIRVMSINSSKMVVRGYGSVELDPALVSDHLGESAEYLGKKIEELFERHIVGKIDSNRAVIGIPTSRTFSRTFVLPADRISGIEEAVNLETEQFVPMPLDSLYVDHQIINRSKDKLTVLTCAVSRQTIDDLLTIVKMKNIEPAMIEPGINAVTRLLKRTEGGDLPTVVIDIGPASTDVAVLDSAIRVTGGLSIGGNTLTLNIANKLNVPLETAHQLKVLNGLNNGPRQHEIAEALRPSLNRILGETKKVIRYYTDRFPSENKLQQIIVVGSGSNVPGLGDFLTDKLVMPARIASPWQDISFGSLPQPTKQMRSRFMTAAGLALVNPEDL